MMRIEAAEGPGDAPTGAHHGAVDIDRQPRELQPRDGLGDQVVIELYQRGQGGLGELPEPVAHRAGGRDPRQPTETRDQRIPGEIPEVLQPARAGVEQRQHQQGEAPPTVVPARRGARCTQSARQIALPEVAAEQLQAAVRGQLLTRELDVQLPLDHLVQARYVQSHQGGLLCVGSNVGAFSLSSAQGAVLFHASSRFFMPQLFSDWGPSAIPSRSLLSVNHGTVSKAARHRARAGQRVPRPRSKGLFDRHRSFRASCSSIAPARDQGISSRPRGYGTWPIGANFRRVFPRLCNGKDCAGAKRRPRSSAISRSAFLQPERHPHLAIQRCRRGEVLVGFDSLARAPIRIAEAEVAVGDKRVHATVTSLWPPTRQALASRRGGQRCQSPR